MRQKSIRLPPELDDELIKVADEENVDQSELVRWGLRFLFRLLRQDQPLREAFMQMLKDEPDQPPANT